MKSYTLYPDIVYEGSLSLTQDIEQMLTGSILEEYESGKTIETQFGWTTDRFLPLNPVLQKLQQLLLQNFYQDVVKHVPQMPKMKVELARPHIISIKPGHAISSDFNHRRWYTGCLWLQTTNKGSHVVLDPQQGKTYSVPDGIMDTEHYIAPKKFKYAFWPAHIYGGYTPNLSLTDTILLEFTFTGGLPGTKA